MRNKNQAASSKVSYRNFARCNGNSRFLPRFSQMRSSLLIALTQRQISFVHLLCRFPGSFLPLIFIRFVALTIPLSCPAIFARFLQKRKRKKASRKCNKSGDANKTGPLIQQGALLCNTSLKLYHIYSKIRMTT